MAWKPKVKLTYLFVIRTVTAITVGGIWYPDVLKIETMAYDIQDKLKNRHINTTFIVSFRSCFRRFSKARLLVDWNRIWKFRVFYNSTEKLIQIKSTVREIFLCYKYVLIWIETIWYLLLLVNDIKVRGGHEKIWNEKSKWKKIPMIALSNFVWPNWGTPVQKIIIVTRAVFLQSRNLINFLLNILYLDLYVLQPLPYHIFGYLRKPGGIWMIVGKSKQGRKRHW